MLGFRNAAAVAACVMLVVCSSAAPADTAADQAAIAGFQDSWEKAYNAYDAAGIVALYADDAVLAPPGSPALHDHAAMQAFLAKDIEGAKAGGISMDIAAATNAGMSGDVAWESGTWTAKDKSGATADVGKYMTVYGKKDGKWSIVADIWNSDKAPAPPPAPAEAAK